MPREMNCTRGHACFIVLLQLQQKAHAARADACDVHFLPLDRKDVKGRFGESALPCVQNGTNRQFFRFSLFKYIKI